MYNNAGIITTIGAAGTSVLATTGSNLSWVGYTLAAASIVVGGMLALRSRMLNRATHVAAGAAPGAGGRDTREEEPR
jgi:hypothetical protein